MKIHTSRDVQLALEAGQPILALESTIIAHGMPFPDNLKFAQQGELLCRDRGVTPAMIAIINGEIHVGLEKDLLVFIAENDSVRKTSRRELGIAIAEKWHGATTVSSTMYIAHQIGIPVFSTGGIGGVHRGAEYSFDISQDLFALANIPMIVISAGAKAILDLPKTLEMMETLSITVIGYKTNEFPAFYSQSSGYFGIHPVSSSHGVATLFRENVSAGLSASVLVANPVPLKDEIPAQEIETIINASCKAAATQNITGKDLTPFLLSDILDKTSGRSLETNQALAINNIKLGIDVAKELAQSG
jgi:pseudouridine-5'-phosphate glycosidase